MLRPVAVGPRGGVGVRSIVAPGTAVPAGCVLGPLTSSHEAAADFAAGADPLLRRPAEPQAAAAAGGSLGRGVADGSRRGGGGGGGYTELPTDPDDDDRTGRAGGSHGGSHGGSELAPAASAEAVDASNARCVCVRLRPTSRGCATAVPPVKRATR